MPTYAHPGQPPIPNRKRCKIRHSEQMPARCKLARDHEGECRFGWWPDPVTHPSWRGQVTNLDLPLPKVSEHFSTEYLAALAAASSTEPEDATP